MAPGREGEEAAAAEQYAGVLSVFAQYYDTVIGGRGVLYLGNAVDSEEYNISWKVDGTTTIIAEISPTTNATYGGRCTGGQCRLRYDGTLIIENLTSADNTTYIQTATKGATTLISRYWLNVYNRLSPPTLISSPSTHPLNGTTFHLTCNAGAQDVHQIYFFRDQKPVSCDMFRLSCNTSSPILSFNPILDIDTGNYTCKISNPGMGTSSEHIYLNVGVRVSQVTLSKNTSSPITVGKDSVALTCSSHGSDVSYQWTLMGSPLPQNSRYHLMNNNATLIISPVTRSDQGDFVCAVSNYLNSGVSNPLRLTWLPDGQITCDAKRLDQNIHLYCFWPGGYPPAQVYMKYHNVDLSELNGVTSIIPSSQFPPEAMLSCTGTYMGSGENCSVVIESPQSPGFINGSTTRGKKGSSVFLSVLLSGGKAAHILPSTFSWFREEQSFSKLTPGEEISIVSSDYSSILIVRYMTKEMSGRYMCKAENNIGMNSFTFNVEIDKDDVLSAGAIAGIVIGCIVALLLSVLVYFLIHHHKKGTLNRR